MRTRRPTAALAPAFGGRQLEVVPAVGGPDEWEKAESAGLEPAPAFLRHPRSPRFADSGVMTLQHWLDLNA